MKLELINGFWIGPGLTRLEQLSIKSFLHLGHPFRLYCYEKLDNVPEGAEIADARRFLSYDNAKKYSSPGMASDVFRYKLMWEEGGWWVDLDTVALKPFVFRQPVVFGKLGAADHFANGVMRTTPRWAPMGECLRRIEERYGFKAEWSMAGPHMLSEVVRDIGGSHFALPEHTFYPFLWEQCGTAYQGPAREFPNSHAVHLWHEWSRRRKIDMNAVHHPETLFETLHRKYP